MNQSDAETIGTALADAGFDFAATLPADQLHALQAWVSKSQRFQTVAVTNEGEGVAICAGAWLAGKMPVIILETSGILLSTYALMALAIRNGTRRRLARCCRTCWRP